MLSGNTPDPVGENIRSITSSGSIDLTRISPRKMSRIKRMRRMRKVRRMRKIRRIKRRRTKMKTIKIIQRIKERIWA